MLNSHRCAIMVNMMMGSRKRGRHVGIGAGALLFLIASAPLVHAQTPSQIVASMATNEMAARNKDSLYSYNADEVSARTGGHRWTEKVVETGDGPLHRLLAIDGKPLSPEQAKAETARIDDAVRHPEELRRLAEAHKDDEGRAQQLLQLLPKAFVLTLAGEVDGCVQFVFHPNPSFQPSSYEERIAAAMDGTVSLNHSVDRLCTLKATISRPVEFGFGFLGRVEQGGHFSLDRRPVDLTHWKSDYISVHMQGRILLMKTLTREQEVSRTNLRLIPQNTSLAKAAQMTAE